MEIENLVKDCINNSIELGKYSYEIIVQPRVTNRIYDKCYKNFMKHKSYGDEGINEIEKMIENENDYVKKTAAVHLLPYRTKIALKTLQVLAKKYENQIGLFSFNIEMVIKEWNKGNLRDYYTYK
ncbi:hypothetical protein GE107_25915 [Cohnella sp. CFH 77786]|uniref:hypothetical protein n=1 Tax=Cohnella sp. CFH 77786 TaxID=2662265 RepID=UPI001C60D14B|nr:hypothetical protein [Cohnella sp. CFH 77786]MBW5449451.1 hypothetical protein [Cohnella sp. CFH 77786]